MTHLGRPMIASTAGQLTPTPLEWLLLGGLVAVVVVFVVAAAACGPSQSDSADLEDEDLYDLSRPVWFGPQRPAQPAGEEDAKPHVPDVSSHTRRDPM